MKKSVEVLDPPFQIHDGEYFDLTLSNQSRNFENIVKMSCGKAVVYADHPPNLATLLLNRFPLEDQGLVLILGPLPLNATTYPASRMFNIRGSFRISASHGLGLVIRVEDARVSVQYGNGIFMLSRDIMERDYEVYSTGLPSLSDKDFADSGEWVL